MSKWTVEIRISEMWGDAEPEIITRTDDEDTEMVLKLCQVGPGAIVYNGRNGFVSKPVADPIRRVLTYRVELY